VGFTGRDFTTDIRWTITAGHCSNGALVNWGTVGETIGPMIASMDSGSVDASAILINNPRYTNDLGGRIYRDAAFGGIVDVDAVAGTLSDIVAGDTVCLSANFTDVNGPNLCGVIGTNSDPAVRGMARVDGVDACGGDSGGGWYGLSGSTRTAYGFHSRSDVGCHGAAATADSWFSPWPTVQSALVPGLDIEIR
jgi:streptogrisin C